LEDVYSFDVLLGLSTFARKHIFFKFILRKDSEYLVSEIKKMGGQKWGEEKGTKGDNGTNGVQN